MNETMLIPLLCGLLGGAEDERKHSFVNNGTEVSVVIDCETRTHVIEIGRDVRSSRDSIHQAELAAWLTDKTPMVILIDTDGREGRYEQEMRFVAERLGVAYGVCSEPFLVRWAATAPFRRIGSDKTLNDLPIEAMARGFCDIHGLDLPS